MGGGDSTLFPHFGERMIVLDVLSHPVELVILQSVKKKNVTHTTISRRDILEGTVYLQFRFRSWWICPDKIGGDSTLCPHFGEKEDSVRRLISPRRVGNFAIRFKKNVAHTIKSRRDILEG